jgi:hypothetical protein
VAPRPASAARRRPRTGETGPDAGVAFASARPHISRLLDQAGADPELVASARGFLSGRPGNRTPLGAAAATAAAAFWRSDVPALADSLIATDGLAFAAQTCAELGGLCYGDGGGTRYQLRRHGPDTGPYYAGWIPATSVIRQVRAYLAACSDDEHEEVCRAFAGYRGGSLRQRTVVSYLLPSRTDWVDEDSVAGGGWLLVYSLRTAEQLDAYRGAAQRQHPETTGDLATALEGIGTTGAGAIVRWVESWVMDDRSNRRCFSC